MSFFSSVVQLARKRKIKDSGDVAKINNNVNPATFGQFFKWNFSLRDYVKESFSVLIARPFSAYIQSFFKICLLLIAGILIGGAITLISCLIILIYSGTLKSTLISTYLINKIEKTFSNRGLSIKSAALQWNSNIGSVEIALNKIRFDNFFIPKLTILPDYMEFFKQQRIVANAISIINPKIALKISDDFQNASINPNLSNKKSGKMLFEPIPELQKIKADLIGANGGNVLIKLANADVSLTGKHWNMRDLHCEYKLGDDFPRIIDFHLDLPKQRYFSSVKITRSDDGLEYDANIVSLNPSSICGAFYKKNARINRFLSLIQGYDLPVSGSIKLKFNSDKTLKECVFDLKATSGVIKIPNRSALTLSLGKRIDSGSVSGSLRKDKLDIDAINVSYGDSNIHFTGLSIPMNDFKFLNIANVDGTLSLANVDTNEMRAILPSNVSKSIISVFRDYSPEFRLDLLKFDLKGEIAFGNRISDRKLSINQGIFKIHDAKIPINGRMATNVNVIGKVKSNGLDIKISNAMFGKTRINNGVFFFAKKDKSCNGTVNADIPIEDIAAYAPSNKLTTLPLKKLNINEIAKFNLKLVREVNKNDSGLRFKVLEGDGTTSSNDGSKQLKISWNKNKLSAVADVHNGKNNVFFKIEENFLTGCGAGDLCCKGNSEFLADIMPFAAANLSGDFELKSMSSWNNQKEDNADVSINLKNADLFLPIIGNVKTIEETGQLNMHICKRPDDKILLSNIILNTPKTNLRGQAVMDSDYNITECVIDDIAMDGVSVKATISKENDKKTTVSLIGDTFDLDKLFKLFKQAKKKDVKLTAYINIKELLCNGNKIKNVKGTLDILDGKIINGACMGIIGESTVALNARDIDDSNECLLSVSASNAGDFINTLGVGDCVNGGSINFVMKSSKISSKNISGAFDMNNFIIKNNPQLIKLISLSSPNYIAGTDLIVGFNSCTGSLSLEDGVIKIENCKAVGPTIAISMEGEYNRINDEWKASGILLPINVQNADRYLAADFSVSGSYWNPNLSVSAPKFIYNDAVSELFGDMIPQLSANSSNEVDSVFSDHSDVRDDAYALKAFDEAAKKASVKKKAHKPNKQFDKKFGVTINRGLKAE